jgi:GT2 family glycosyltransferase
MDNPKLSVVIASVNGWPSIVKCLSALARQEGNVKAEVIVAHSSNDGTSENIRRNFPWVKLLSFPKRLSIPELRSAAMSCATGDIITVTEDHCIPRKDWYQNILKAHESPYGAVGGAVVNGSVDRLVDWAVYFCEYCQAMPPISCGEVSALTGNNVSYKREALQKIATFPRKSYWDFFLHLELKRAGVNFLSDPNIVVFHHKRFGLLYFLSQRFHYSRSFAGMRNRTSSIPRRTFYVITSPLLPLILLSRVTAEVIRKGRHMKEFAWSLPLLLVFTLSYACGELAGYVFGGGESLCKVE